MIDNVFTLDAYRDRQTTRRALSVSCPWCGQPPGQRCLMFDIDGGWVGYLPDKYVAHTRRKWAAGIGAPA